MACSPSLGLLLPHAERSAVPAGARAHPDGCQDEPVPEAGGLDLHQSDAHPSRPSASDASDGAHPGVAADAALHPFPAVLADADAGKLAGREPDARAQDAFPLALRHARLAQVVPDAAVALYKQAWDRSAAQSCAAQAAGLLQPAEWPDAAELLERLVARKQQSKARYVPAELLLPPEVAAEPQDEPEAQPLRPVLQTAQSASQPLAEQSQGAQQARVEPVL